MFVFIFKRAATRVLESGELDTTNVFVMGGSHGGFLTAHLIGQYPVRLTFCVLFLLLFSPVQILVLLILIILILSVRLLLPRLNHYFNVSIDRNMFFGHLK